MYDCTLIKTAAEKALKERLSMTDRQWRNALREQDDRLALHDAIRGPEKPSFSENLRELLAGHRF